MTVNYCNNDIVFFSLMEITRIIFCGNGKNKYFLVCNPMDGWMIRNLTPFSTVFKSYQDDRWMIMKGCVQWSPFTVDKISQM